MKSAQVCGSPTLLASIEDWVMEGHRLAQTVAYGDLSNDNPSPITPEYERQAAVRVLAELTGRDSLSSPSELDSSDYQKAAVALLKRLNEQVLDHALAALRVN